MYVRKQKVVSFTVKHDIYVYSDAGDVGCKGYSPLLIFSKGGRNVYLSIEIDRTIPLMS